MQYNPNFNEEAIEDDMVDEDDGWGEADDNDEYANKQFDNIEDDSFKIRCATIKLAKELLAKCHLDTTDKLNL